MDEDATLSASPSGERFVRYEYQREEDFAREVVAHFRELFGEKVFHFQTPIRLAIPNLDRSTIPDDFALDWSDPSRPRLLMIEYERFVHDIYSHISTQVMRFRDAFPNSKNEIYGQLRTRCPPDRRDELWEAVYKQPVETLMIIDRANESIKNVAAKYDVKVIEFHTYAREPERQLDNLPHLHAFVPYRQQARLLTVPRTASGLSTRYVKGQSCRQQGRGKCEYTPVAGKSYERCNRCGSTRLTKEYRDAQRLLKGRAGTKALDHILEVVQEMRSNQSYSEACKQVADRRGLKTPTSVADQCTRELGIKTEQFEQFFNSGTLRDFLRSKFQREVEKIDRAFS